MAQVISMNQPLPPNVEPGGYVNTETARDITRSLELAVATGGATMIAGTSGVGKTTAVRTFAEGLESIVPQYPAYRWITITSGIGSPWNVLSQLLEPYGFCPRQRGWSAQDGQKWLVEAFHRTTRMIVVDEAQYLNQRTHKSHEKGAAFEFLRGLSEAAEVSLVFTGDLALVDGIRLFPQLESRMRRPIISDRPTTGDVAALAASYGVRGALETQALAAVARKPGALRNVAGVLDMARIFAGGATPTGEYIRAAIIDLKLDPKGGRA